MESKIETFISYAHEDETLRQGLEKQLSVLQRQGLIQMWHDREISVGKEWAREIDAHLNTAQIILLLISPSFMTSNYCYSIEMKRATERHERGEACVIPIILSPVFWQKAPFGKLQALPKDAKPVISWRNRTEALFNVAEGIRKAIEEMTSELAMNIVPWASTEEELTKELISNIADWTSLEGELTTTPASKVSDWASVEPALDRHLPVYLLLNTSGSIEGAPIESVSQGLELFQREVWTDPFACDVVKVGVITFGREARLVTNGLISISMFYAPYLVARGRERRFDLAFKILLESIDRDLKKGVAGGQKGDWKPIVFVMLDSYPTDEFGNETDLLWQPARDSAINHPKRYTKPSSIVAVGCGPNLDDVLLKSISTGTFFRMGSDAAAFVKLFQYISQSIFNSVPRGHPDDPFGDIPPDVIRPP